LTEDSDVLQNKLLSKNENLQRNEESNEKEIVDLNKQKDN